MDCAHARTNGLFTPSCTYPFCHSLFLCRSIPDASRTAYGPGGSYQGCCCRQYEDDRPWSVETSGAPAEAPEELTAPASPQLPKLRVPSAVDKSSEPFATPRGVKEHAHGDTDVDTAASMREEDPERLQEYEEAALARTHSAGGVSLAHTDASAASAASTSASACSSAHTSPPRPAPRRWQRSLRK